MKALILGAGQGSRLLPLTETEPKALLNIGGKSVVEWQIDGLLACGVTEICFLAGFNLPVVEQALAALAQQRPGCDLRVLHNPFYKVADNLASCWMARGEMTGDFLVLNGDTLFSPGVLKILLESPAAPITLAVDHKAHYDEDDMKVELSGTRLRDIGKKLPAERVQGESIGMLRFLGEGGERFVARLEEAMRDQAALKLWYLSIIASLAGDTEVQTATISGHDWCEIDYPLDLQRARQMVAGWRGAESEKLPSAGTS